MAERLRIWLREPLVHFLLLGFVVFVFSAWRGEAVDPDSRTITLNAEQVERLTATWAQTWNRAPTRVEIDDIIRDHVREEVYYREAKRMGLDADDPIVRRRLASKMESFVDSSVENTVPSDATLQAWLDKMPQKYAADPVYSFDQLYIGGNDPDVARGRAQRLLAALAQGADWASLGDPLPLPRSLETTSKTEIVRSFGPDFAEALGREPKGSWSGPVMSGFGLHLVRIRSVTVPGKPRLVDVRQAVENDWRAATGEARRAKAYQALLDGYTIRIAKP